MNEHNFSALEDQLRECFGRVLYSYKTHMKMADDETSKLKCFKTWQIVLSAITSSGVIGIIFSQGLDLDIWLKIITALISLISICLNTYLKSFDPGACAQKHISAADKLWNIKESYMSLLTDIRMQSITIEDSLKKRDRLQHTLSEVYASAPQANYKAYASAQRALKEQEEHTFSDDEIDKLLPQQIRKSSKK